MARREFSRPRGIAAACALAALCSGSSYALDPAAQKLADRYEALLRANPGQAAALDKFWSLYQTEGQTALLLARLGADRSVPPLFTAQILRRSGDKSGAFALLKPLAEKDAAAARLAAQWLVDDGDPAQAATLLEKAGNSTKDPGLLAQAGEVWSQAGQPAKALACWQQATAANPANLDLQTKLAETLEATGDRAAALELWLLLSQQGDPDQRLNALERIVQNHAQSGQIDAAADAQATLLSQLSRSHWKYAEAQTKLFRLFQQAGRLPELEQRWKQAPLEDTDAPLRLADLYAYLGESAERLDAFREAVRRSPENSALASQLAREEFAQGHLDEAARILTQIAAKQKPDTDAIFLGAEIAALQGHTGEAEASIAALLQEHAGEDAMRERAREFFHRLRLIAAEEKLLREDIAQRPADADLRESLVRLELENKRFAEASREIDTTPWETFETSARSTTLLRFANLLREENMLPEALGLAQKAAAESRPPSLESTALLAELLIALDRDAEARALILQDLGSRQEGASPEVDRRLFSSLHHGLATTEETDGKALAALQTLATQTKGEPVSLRLAHWQQWNNKPTAAETTLREALAQQRDSLVLTEALADHLSINGNLSGAIEQWQALIALAPERAPEIQRKIGQLQLARKAPDAAVSTLSALQKAHPQDWHAASDLADAQQQAGDWFNAYETWLLAEQLAPAEARQSLRGPLLAAAGHLQLRNRGLDYLEQAALAEKDPAARFDLAREAAAFAHDQGVEDDWRARLSQRAGQNPTDPFWPSALALLLEERGQLDEARAALNQAQSLRPTKPAAEELLKLTEKSGAYREAALLASGGPEAQTSGRQIQRANLLEKAGDLTAATAAWTTIAARFARDPVALVAAADYFERGGQLDQADSLVQAASDLGAPSPQLLLRLGRRMLAKGDRAAALADFEKLLATTQPEPLERLVLPPAAGNEKAIPSEAETEGCRLRAIKAAGELLINAPGKTEWAARFLQASEHIWALFSTGQTTEALAAIRSAVEAKPDDDALVGGFASLALRAGALDQLPAWANALPFRAQARWSAIVGALSTQQQWPEAEPLADLISKAPPLHAWEICRLLAAHGDVQLALKMAKGTPERLMPQTAARAWLELARWSVGLPDLETGRRAADAALAVAPLSCDAMDPIFEALRLRWLLTPEQDRPAFAAGFQARLNPKSDPAARDAILALLAELRGDTSEADRQLTDELAALSLAESPVWQDAVQKTGILYQQWGLTRLARSVMRAYLASDPAQAALRADNLRTRAESFLLASKILDAQPASVPYLVEGWQALGAAPEVLLGTARQLVTFGQPEKAVILVRILCATPPSSDGFLLGLLGFTYEPRMLPILDPYVRGLLASPSYLTTRPPIANAAVRLASLQLQENNPIAALSLLDLARNDAGPPSAVLMLRSRALQMLGRYEEALDQFEKSPTSAPAEPACVIEMAQLAVLLGKEDRAKQLLDSQLSPSSPLRMSAALQMKELAVSTGDHERLLRATELASDILPSNNADLSDEVAFHQEIARLDFAYPTPFERFQAGSQLLAVNLTLPPSFQEVELAKLGRIATANPTLQPNLMELRRTLAQAAGRTEALKKSLSDEWRAGSQPAGDLLVDLALAEKGRPDLAPLIDRYLSPGSYQRVAWLTLAEKLIDRKEGALAERVAVAIQQQGGESYTSNLSLLQALWLQGKPTAKLSELLAQAAEAEPSRHLDLARAYLRFGRLEAALFHLRDRVGIDKNLQAALLGEAAKQLLARGRVPEAGELLHRISESSVTRPSPELLAAYYEMDGRLSSLQPTENEFSLPEISLGAFQTEALDRLVAAGNNARALAWFQTTPRLLEKESLRAVFQQNEGHDWKTSEAIWSAALAASPLWETRRAAAQFYLRYALDSKTGPESARQNLKKAFSLDPGSPSIARAYATKLARDGQQTAARKVMENAIASVSTAPERALNRAFLQQVQAVLPTKKH